MNLYHHNNIKMKPKIAKQINVLSTTLYFKGITICIIFIYINSYMGYTITILLLQSRRNIHKAIWRVRN